MSGELRVNRITSRSGINTLDFTGDGFSYVTNVGFGTTNPKATVHVQGNLLVDGGNVGIGTTVTSFKVDVSNGDIRLQNGYKVRFGGNSGTTNFYIQYNSTTNSLDFVSG